jgi:hypothetical protein
MMHCAALLLPPKFVDLMLLILASFSSPSHNMAAVTAMTTTVHNDPRTLQPDNSSANNLGDVGISNGSMPKETEDAPPLTPVPTPKVMTPNDFCLICDKGALL